MKNCFLIPILFLFASNHLAAQSKKMDSLLTVLAIEKNDSEKVKTLYFISRNASKESHYIDGIHYAELSFALADSIHYVPGSARAAVAAGIAHFHLGNFGEAIRNDLVALGKYQALGSELGMGDAENSLGSVYYDQKIYDKALKHYSEALRHFRTTHIKLRIIGTFNNVANAYNGIGDYRRALQMYDSVRIAQAGLKNELGLSDCYMSIGQAYSGLKKNDSALIYYRLAVPYYEKSMNTERMAYAYGCFGEVFTRMKMFGEAKTWLEKGLTLKEKMEDKITFKELYFMLSICDSALGDLSSAYDEFGIYLAYRDSLQNDDDIRKQTSAELQFQYGKQAASDSVRHAEEMNRNHIRQQEEIHQQFLYTLGGISGCALALVAAIISFTAYRQNRKRNLIIAHQKEIVEMKQKEMLDSIHYAERIQRAMLPSEKYISRKLSELK